MKFPTTRDELVAALRELSAARPSNKADLKELERRCTALSLYLAKHDLLCKQVPHLIWHFLSDADIRFKDPQYADMQLGEVESVLASWGEFDAT